MLYIHTFVHMYTHMQKSYCFLSSTMQMHNMQDKKPRHTQSHAHTHATIPLLQLTSNMQMHNMLYMHMYMHVHMLFIPSEPCHFFISMDPTDRTIWFKTTKNLGSSVRLFACTTLSFACSVICSGTLLHSFVCSFTHSLDHGKVNH